MDVKTNTFVSKSIQQLQVTIGSGVEHNLLRRTKVLQLRNRMPVLAKRTCGSIEQVAKGQKLVLPIPDDIRNIPNLHGALDTALIEV